MGRTPCCEKNGLKKGPWTTEEDQKLIGYIQKHGYGNWRTLPKNAGLQRCGKSCRLRWTNYLRPDIKRGRFSFEEEETIIQLHSILGNKWSAIASRLPGRTDNEIKNYWNTHIRKRLLRMGIDPVTHSPRLDLLDLSSILYCSSLYGSSPSSQMSNLQRLLGMQMQQQPLVNPELLKLASSLISSQQRQDNNNLDLQNQLCINNPQIQNLQFQDTAVTTTFSTPCVSSFPLTQPQLAELEPNVDPYDPSSFTDLTDWHKNGIALSTLTDEFYNIPDQLSSYINYYSSDNNQNLVYQSSNFQNSNNSNQFLSTSTPSSSPTPLNSNSTYMNGSINNTEDERESYDSSNGLRFEIPLDNIFDANEFM